MSRLLIPAALAALLLPSAGAQAADPIPAGSWLIESVRDAGTLDTAQTHFVLKDDGSISATVGCNRMAGKARFEAATIAIGPVISTRMACAEALMKQEQAFAKALEAARTYKVEGSMLTLLDESGGTLVTFAKAPD